MSDDATVIKSFSFKHLSFWINNQLYGLPITEVVQIIGVQKIVSVPEYPSYAKGIINLRGVVIPVIDIRTRFHLDEVAYTERTCIIVTNISGRPAGFLVDAVDEVMTLQADDIEAPPYIGINSDEQFVTGIGTLQNRLILLLSSSRLICAGDL